MPLCCPRLSTAYIAERWAISLDSWVGTDSAVRISVTSAFCRNLAPNWWTLQDWAVLRYTQTGWG